MLKSEDVNDRNDAIFEFKHILMCNTLVKGGGGPPPYPMSHELLDRKMVPRDPRLFRFCPVPWPLIFRFWGPTTLGRVGKIPWFFRKFVKFLYKKGIFVEIPWFFRKFVKFLYKKGIFVEIDPWFWTFLVPTNLGRVEPLTLELSTIFGPDQPWSEVPPLPYAPWLLKIFSFNKCGCMMPMDHRGTSNQSRCWWVWWIKSLNRIAMLMWLMDQITKSQHVADVIKSCSHSWMVMLISMD